MQSSRQTLAFTNDTQYPILIKGINAHNKVTFEVWGVDDGRTVQLLTHSSRTSTPASSCTSTPIALRRARRSG